MVGQQCVTPEADKNITQGGASLPVIGPLMGGLDMLQQLNHYPKPQKTCCYKRNV